MPARARLTAVAAALAASLAASPALAEGLSDAGAGPAGSGPACGGGQCRFQLTPDQLLGMIERLVAEKNYAEALPLVEGLAGVPGMEVPNNFLRGLIALETGDAKTAAARFRAILSGDPSQTRARLELARALALQGDRGAAEYHLRLAQNDRDLPDDVVRSIRQARSVLRSDKDWKLGFDIGLAPDSNINAATNAETVEVNFGPARLPLTLDANARAKSGTGLTAGLYGSFRLPTSEKMAIVTDLDASMVNYKGNDVDDYSAQLAVGPELRVGLDTTVSVQGVALQRWYGGQTAARQFGAKLALQHDLGSGRRLGLQLDGRHNASDFGDGYSGWQIGAAATGEQVIGRSAIASVSLFARRDLMRLAPFSNTSAGVSLGIGGELPWGINAGLSGSAGFARYDAAQSFFSTDRRSDWRFQTRAFVGLRKLRYFGFSPSVEYRFSSVDTNYALYRSSRHRLEFKLARYF